MILKKIKNKLKKGDNIIVIAGKDKGKKGEILSVNPLKQVVLVKGVNVVKKHQKPSGENAGGIIEKELPLAISNVAYFDTKSSKPTKIGYKVEDDKKVRYAKASGTTID